MTDLDRYRVAIARGDAEAFAAWLREAEAPIRRSLASFAAKVDTEAVLQESLLRVWQVAPRFAPDGRPNGLVRLAVRIARNLAISELRRARVEPVELDRLERAAADVTVQVRPPDPMLRRLIVLCRERLPDKPASALGARLESRGGRSDQALAAGLGMTKNTFLQNFTRARKFLAECLKGQGVDLDKELV